VPTESYIISWKLIQGTISFSTYSYSSTQISQYANTQISALQLATFSSSANHVTGTGTNFLLDFAVNDTFLANDEFGTVSILISDTAMDIYVPPSSPYTNVPAYRVAGPRYRFNSIPTSIDEGANGTFDIITSYVANNTTLYWTVDNVTTSSGDFA
jgi:hypothetical protein